MQASSAEARSRGQAGLPVLQSGDEHHNSTFAHVEFVIFPPAEAGQRIARKVCPRAHKQHGLRRPKAA